MNGCDWQSSLGACIDVVRLQSSNEENRSQGYHQQALYCYRKLYQLDPSNVNALWDRASLAKEVGDLRTVRVFK